MLLLERVESRFWKTTDVKLYYPTKFTLYLSSASHYFYTGISCMMLCSSIRFIILESFYLLMHLLI